jgi:hypothetical protein
MMLDIQKKMTILLSLFSMTALSVIMILISPTTSCEAFTSSSSSSSSSSTMTARRMVASSSSSTTSSTKSSSSSSSSSLTLPKTQYPDPNLNNPWYSTKIQTDMSYSTKVKSLYLRHCVVERKETAELALQWYLQLTSGGSVENVGTNSGDDDDVVIHTSRDPFGDVTKQLSACTMTREEGGKIGWVDIEVNKKSNELTYSSLIPSDILKKLIELQPKAGDVHIIGPSSHTNQVHLIRVEELYIPNIVLPTERKSLSTLTSIDSKEINKLGSFNGINALVSRNKLKGHGKAEDPFLPISYLVSRSIFFVMSYFT